MYVQGVSTRKVKEITEVLCGYEISSSQVSRVTKELDEQFEQWRTRALGKVRHLLIDARYEKVRHGGQVKANVPEGFTVFKFPQAHWKKLRTSNLAERVNKEIKRRTRVVGIFPNCSSCLRLITALLVEIDEEWEQERNYLNTDEC
jgi:transposase-like protein